MRAERRLAAAVGAPRTSSGRVAKNVAGALGGRGGEEEEEARGDGLRLGTTRRRGRRRGGRKASAERDGRDSCAGGEVSRRGFHTFVLVAFPMLVRYWPSA